MAQEGRTQGEPGSSSQLRRQNWECTEAMVGRAFKAEYQEDESCMERALQRAAEGPPPSSEEW